MITISTIIFVLCIIAIAATISWYACRKVRDRLLGASIVDKPNERSMHKWPVPRGGGIAIWIAVFFISTSYDINTGHPFYHLFLVIAVGALVTVSWLDDKKSLPARERFMVHILAVALGLTSLPITQFVFQGILPLWLDRVVAGFAWLWFINLTNFMDGIDGITGAQTTHVSIGFIIIALLAGGFAQSDLVLAASIAGAAIGFLLWNWHPAKLFLGDVGSIPLGFLLGYLMMVLATHGYLGVAITLPLYYVTDASMTLIRRILEKKKFWQAHREHFYQQAAMGCGSPVPVVKAIIIGNFGLLLITVAAMTLSVWMLVFAPLLVAGLLWYLKRMNKLKEI